MTKVLAFAGSLRKSSWNKKLVAAAAEGARQAGAEVTLIDIKDFPLPLYDGDIEANEGLPANALKLKELFKSHNALLIASPEYNSHYSGVLKNLIDWVSRPQPGEKPLEAFRGKPVAIMGASPGAKGAMRMLPHLRDLLLNIQMHVLPGMYGLAGAGEAFDDEGQLRDEKVAGLVKGLGQSVVDMAKRLA
ncbi:MAG: NAD(P)H-dependent oxidoreductase [Planctomycetes bacterium]|nr:NAD(P)H-dependent oxidoreductase [Planctomycetota bacterium]MCA8938038.1 NAD(P)H-dependent oxidoreductase [Planctomycetota bacterium]MCA8945446.1 NAD(P)H-dependent oxidoreductase [Planctomycetota bacterium]